MEKYRASQNQLQFASDFDDADLNCASLQKPETTESYVDSTISNMLADVDRGFRDAELDLRSTVDSHPFYVLFEPALGCDSRTDHTTPKSVWPIFMADVSQILAALQSSITSAVEPRVRELVRSREEILADSFLQQNSGVARREQELRDAREETGALRTVTGDLRAQKDEMQEALVKEITMLREQLFQKRRIGGTYKPDFAPGSGTEATSLSLQPGKAVLYTQQEVDALLRDYTQQQAEERKRYESKLRAELTGAQEQVAKLAAQLESTRETLVSTQHELDSLRVRYDEDMEGCKAGYEEQVADLVQQISSLQAAASLSAEERDNELASRDQAIQKLQDELLELSARGDALREEMERAGKEADEKIRAMRRDHDTELENLRNLMQARHREELAATAGEAAAQLQKDLDAARDDLQKEREESERLRKRLAAAAKEMSDTVEQLRLQHESDMSDLRSSMNSFSVMSEFAQDVENAERELKDVLKCVDLIFGRIFDESKGTLTRMLITKDFGGQHSAGDAGPSAPNPIALYAAPESSGASATSASASANASMNSANDAASTLGDDVLAAGPGGSIPTSPLRAASAAGRPSTAKGKGIPKNYLYTSVERAINTARLGKVANKYLVKPLRRLLQWSKLYSNEHLCALFGVDYTQWEKAVAGLLNGSAVGSAMDALRGLTDLTSQGADRGSGADIGFDYSDSSRDGALPDAGPGSSLPPSGRRPRSSLSAVPSSGAREQPPAGRQTASAAAGAVGASDAHAVPPAPPVRPSSASGTPYNAVNSVMLRQDKLVSRPETAGAQGSGAETVSRGTSARRPGDAAGWREGDSLSGGAGGCEVGVNTEISTSLADSMYRLASGDAVVVDQSRVFECQDCMDIRKSLSEGSRGSSASNPRAGSRPEGPQESGRDSRSDSRSGTGSRPGSRFDSRSGSAGARPSSGARSRATLTAEEREAGIYEDTDGTPGTLDTEGEGRRPLRPLDSRPNSGEAPREDQRAAASQGPLASLGSQDQLDQLDALGPRDPQDHQTKGPSSPQRVASAPPSRQGFRCPRCGYEISLRELAAWYPVHQGFPTFFYDSDAAEVPVLTRDNLGLPPGWPSGPQGAAGMFTGTVPVERGQAANADARFLTYTQRMPDGRERVLEEPILEGVFARILQRAEEMKARFSRKRELILQERRRTTERILRALSLLNEDRIRATASSPRLFSATMRRAPPPAFGGPSSPSGGHSSSDPWGYGGHTSDHSGDGRGARQPAGQLLGSPGPQPAARRQRSRILYFEGRPEPPSLTSSLFRPPSGRRVPGADSGDSRPVVVPARDYTYGRPGAGGRPPPNQDADQEPFTVVTGHHGAGGGYAGALSPARARPSEDEQRSVYHLGPGMMPSAEALARYRDALLQGDAPESFGRSVRAGRAQNTPVDSMAGSVGPGHTERPSALAPSQGLTRRRPSSASYRDGPAGARPDGSGWAAQDPLAASAGPAARAGTGAGTWQQGGQRYVPESFYEFPRSAAEARPGSGRARPSSGKGARTPSRPASRPASGRPGSARQGGVQAASNGTPVRYAVQALPNSAQRQAGPARPWQPTGPAVGKQQDVLELLAEAGVVQKKGAP